MPEVEEFEAIPGHGVKARLGPASLTVGSPAFLTSRGVDVAARREHIHELEAEGFTVIGVAREGALIGVLALGEPRTIAERLSAAGYETKVA